MRRVLVWALALSFAFVVAVFLNSTTLLAPPGSGRPTLLAHRGLAQTYHREGLTDTTCTAARIDPPEHSYLENTLASMEAAFRAGADIVEFDVHPTTDGAFAVIHDWSVDCRTEGKGVTREQSLAALKALDIGYGYTADGGQTYPFRGKGVGLMPSLDEVLAAFPERRLIINVKSNDLTEGEKLADRLEKLPAEPLARLMVYGGERPIDVLRTRLPTVPVMSRASLKACAWRYLAIGWSGYVPAACRNSLLVLPANVAPFAWGWPHRFVDRMAGAGTLVFVAGDHDGGSGASGIDTEAQFRALPAGYGGGVWTNRIDRIGPISKR